MSSLRRLLGMATVSAVVAACSALPGTSPTASPSPSPTALACGPDSPLLKNAGRLTLSTDIPAFPPWWGGDAAEQYDNEPEGGSEWSSADFSAEPYSMEGLEGATAYAIAEALGFSPDQVDWLANPQFDLAFAPGEKPFDFHMAQVSIREDRAQAVDFSEPYFDANQSVLALSGNDIVNATSIEDLKAFKLGAASNTTSFELIENVIQPTQEPGVYPDNATAKTALQNGQIDGLVVDLGTAFFMRDAELEDFDTPDPEAKIVGQFGEGVQVDQVGAVLEKDSPFTECVNQALAELREDGTLDAILDEWIVSGQEIPFLE
jgi:polar amino acid transport system substrate-binding protein